MNHPYMAIIVPSSIIIPIIVVALRYKSLPRAMRILFYYLLVTVLIYIISFILAVTHHSNTLVIHIDTLVESLFLLWFFQDLFSKKPMGRWIKWIMIAFTVFCCLNGLLFQGIHRYNTYSRPVEAVLILLLSACYWWDMEEGVEGTNAWGSMTLNWMLSGLVIYFSSAFFLFLYSNLLVTRYDLSVNELAWNIHATLILIMYIFFAIGFSKCKI